VGELNKFGLVDLLHLDKARSSAHMQNANHIVQVIAVYRQTGMLTVDDSFHDFIDIQLEINACYFIARHHDVVDCYLLEVEYIKQHILSLCWNTRR